MDKYFICNYCNEIIYDVFESDCCGKLYCSSCIGNLINKPCKYCPNTLQRFSKNIFAERLMHSIIVKCKYGCEKRLPFNSMRTHLLSCEKKVYECSFPKCNYKGIKKDMLNHLVHNHEIYLLFLMENYDYFKTEINKITNNENAQEKENETLVIAESSFSSFRMNFLNDANLNFHSSNIDNNNDMFWINSNNRGINNINGSNHNSLNSVEYNIESPRTFNRASNNHIAANTNIIHDSSDNGDIFHNFSFNNDVDNNTNSNIIFSPNHNHDISVSF